MKRFAAIAALAIALGAGAASAQKVADLGYQGMDPASGKAPKQAVVLFHGYGLKGADMKQLAERLAARLPDAAFVYNDGPLSAYNAKSWYVMEGEDTNNTRGAVKKIATDTVNKVSTGLKVPHDKIVAVGFSQGGGVAFDAGTCVTPDVKAVVSLAGVIANGDCKKEASGAPAAVLIVHNDKDPEVNAEWIKAFQTKATASGYAPKLETVSGATHWPAEAGLKKAEDFIVAQLGGK